MSPTMEHLGHHQPRVRKRARVVSWGLAPLVLLGILVWFLFNAIVCMGGYASPGMLRACSLSNLLPDFLGLFLGGALAWLVLALRDFGREMGEDSSMADRNFIVRHAANARHAYSELDDEYKSSVLFALEMAAWATAVALTTLVFYWFELAFPLGIVVLYGLTVIVVRLSRRGIEVYRRKFGAHQG